MSKLYITPIRDEVEYDTRIIKGDRFVIEIEQ